MRPLTESTFRTLMAQLVIGFLWEFERIPKWQTDPQKTFVDLVAEKYMMRNALRPRRVT